jgi:hypothetical protein
MGMNGDPSVELHRVAADWGEGTSFQNGGMGAAAMLNDATWLYRFYDSAAPATSPTWTTPGGDYTAAVSATAVISDDHGGGQLFSWSTSGNPQMLSDLQGWLDNPSTNFGWVLLGDESKGETVKRLNSGESNVPPMLQVQYVVVPESLPGDYNGNDTVDAADYTVWRHTLGSRSNLAADGNGNFVIDEVDYEVWQQNFGDTVGSVGPAVAPEPASIALAMVAFVFATGRDLTHGPR